MLVHYLRRVLILGQGDAIIRGRSQTGDGEQERYIKFSNEDTIAAIITPPGEGGLGAIRIAGPEAPGVTAKIFRPIGPVAGPHHLFHLYYGYVVNGRGDVIDEVTMVQMPEGRSYTGQKQTEIFCHGGQFVLRQILSEILKYGIRAAEPGEFTRRAFLAGRIDLARAEAVADLVASKTEFAYTAAKNNLLGRLSQQIDRIKDNLLDVLSEIEASVDYPEEDIEVIEHVRASEVLEKVIGEIRELVETYRTGRIIREGFKVAIAGRPNAGKSSLFNLLLNQDRAIVTPQPGTTRDYLTEWIDLEGVAVSITDTAGLRGKGGVVERAGQKSAESILKGADLIVWIADATRRSWEKELQQDVKSLAGRNSILLANKIDKLSKTQLSKVKGSPEILPVSCLTSEGLKDLRSGLLERVKCDFPDLTDRLILTSERHKKKLEMALKYLKKAEKSLKKDVSPELVAFELRQGINEIDEITGHIYNEEILDRIFSRFCIGK